LAEPLVRAVYRQLLHVGATPLLLIELESLEEILLREGSDAQLSSPPPLLAMVADHIDAQLTIASKSNTKALSGIKPARVAKRREANSKVARILRGREQSKSYRWASTLYPTIGYAQDAEMSLSEFEEFVFDICFLNDPDPI